MMLALALLALAPPTEAGVWLDAPPRPGTVVTAPLDVRGETQALEGVLRVDLFVVNGSTVRLVQTVRPAVPVGPVPFSFRWDPASGAPGTVTLRVVATTLVRGFSAEAPGLVVPRPTGPTQSAVAPPGRAAAESPASAVAARTADARAAYPPAELDDSGRTFGAAAPVLPYAPPPTPPAPAAVALPAPARAAPDRAPWTSVAAGLLLLVVSSHVHLVLRKDGP